MLTGGEIMVKCLEAEGVDILFGYPGAAICPFYDALYDSWFGDAGIANEAAASREKGTGNAPEAVQDSTGA